MGAALTLRQARFVEEFVICQNAAEAARRAGYSARSARQIAHELLTKHDTQAAIQARQRIHAERLELTRQQVVAAVLEAIRIAKEQAQPATMIRGWVEIAKMTGLDKPESPQDKPLSPGAQRVREKFESMSTEELLELIAAGD